MNLKAAPAIVGTTSRIINDPESRQNFCDLLKKVAVGFLLEYFPTIELPAIDGEKDGTKYLIKGMDLKGFKVLCFLFLKIIHSLG